MEVASNFRNYGSKEGLFNTGRKNEKAVRLYKNYSFVPTGEKDEGEDVYVLDLH